MLNNKKLFCISFILLFTSVILNLPFPHKYPLGETIFTVLNLPIRFANGFHTVGIISLFLLIIGFYLLGGSLNKYRGRFVLIAILIIIFAPACIVNLYQKTFATGIDAVSYFHEDSFCDFDMISGNTLYGECELTFKNYSRNEVQFDVQLKNWHLKMIYQWFRF